MHVLRTYLFLVLGFLLWFVGAWFLAPQPARAVPQLLVDIQSGDVLFAKDAGKRWYPASLTKIMTAYVVFEAIEAGELDLDTPIFIPAFATRVSPSKSGLPADTAIRLEDALFLLMVKSANDVALAIAHYFDQKGANFIDRMNKTARRLGMRDTYFVNPHGLHDQNHYSTARDMAILSLSVWSRYQQQYGTLFSTSTLLLRQQRLRSFNVLLSRFPGANGFKTGFTCDSGYNIVGTAQRKGRALMVIVMGGASPRERNQLSASLLQQGFDGQFSASSTLLTSIVNQPGAPQNMRRRVCGADKAAYQAKRRKIFAAGTQGNVDYLTSTIQARHQDIKILGRFRTLSLPPRMAARDWGNGIGATSDASSATKSKTASMTLPPRRP